MISIKVIEQLHNDIQTSKLDEFSASYCASLGTLNPDYSKLAARLVVSNHQKNTFNTFTAKMAHLYENPIHGRSGIISKELYDNSIKYQTLIESEIDYERDYLIDYFGFKTLEHAYLFKKNGIIVERPQDMWMRVALGIHGNNIKKALITYHLMSQKYFTHATPTLYNAGTPLPQMSSCYLTAMEDDSIEGIYNTLKDCAQISKYSGGIGLHIHNVRSKNSYISGINGRTEGIVPMLKVFNSTAKYVNQGGKRNGSIAIYLEPWHADVVEFLDLKKNQGAEEFRSRDLFYALWIPDLFMKRVETNGKWSLFCPNECPGLSDRYGQTFVDLYEKYEKDGLARETIDARTLWFKILDSQMETGTPYILYKDSANERSNQKNLGTIKSSNLCCEIIEYSDKEETAVCNLASIALPMFVETETDTKVFNYEKLHDITKIIVDNLNRVIDINFYPIEKTRRSNMRHRPIGIGVQGFADMCVMMDIAFQSAEAKELNKLVFETIYHASVEKSVEMAIERKEQIQLEMNYDIDQFNEDKLSATTILESSHRSDFSYKLGQCEINCNELANLDWDHCGAYSSFNGSPASEGLLQFDLWNKPPSNDRYDWTTLKSLVRENGMRNSLLVAPMPTASTSQILGFNECFEPFTSNLYTRQTLAGEFIVINKYLVQELIDLKIWNSSIKNSIIEHKGSIQHFTEIPIKIRNKYKISWELSMRHLIDMAIDRSPYICQSQSMNLWISDPTYNILTSMHFYAWKGGLKTGIYYLRRKAKHQAQQFTIEPSQTQNNSENEVCTTCSA